MKALALALYLAAAPLAVFAAEEAHEGGHAEAHDAAAEAAHQKEFIYEWVNLVLLIAVLGYFARKPVSEYLAARRDTIEEHLDLLTICKGGGRFSRRNLIIWWTT